MMGSQNLERFIAAQNLAYEQALAELRRGHKESHWMWFIFPQMRGLGRSNRAEMFGIASREEAQEYLSHPVLGERLRECTKIVNSIEGRSAGEIFGYPDDLKFRSSMTLFAEAAPGETVFQLALDKYFSGEKDPRTLRLL